jgi:phosphoglycerol transferase MdoB-like AlkP superfamily enzyme
MNYIFNFLKRISILLLIYFTSRVFFLLNNLNLLNSENFSDVSLLLLFLESLRFDLSILLYINSVVFVLLIFPINLHYKKWYKKLINFIFYFVNIPFILLNNIDIEFFQFNQKRITYDFVDLLFLGNDSIQVLPSYIVKYWPLLLLSLFQIFLLTRVPDYNPSRILVSIRSISRSIIIFLIASFFFIIGARGGLQLKPIKVTNAAEISNHFQGLILNTPFCFLHSINNTLDTYNYFDKQFVNTIFNPVKSVNNGIMDKKNVVIIIMESLSKEFVGSFNNKTLTPFIDSLSNHSLVFNNTFSNGLRSIEALPAITASIPNLSNTPFITSVYAQNDFNSLASMLSKVGYSTSFFHGGTRGTMGFYGYTKKAGFDSYYGLEEYNNCDDYDGTWGIYDEPFFNFFAKELKNKSKPFFTTFFSLSAHPPYNIPEKYNDNFADGDLEIHKLISYSDYSLKTFFNAIKNEDWFNNTIFVITADHTSPKSSNKDYKNKIGRYAIPMLFYSPQDSLIGENNTITQHIDIMPSILDYLDYNKPFFSFGESVFKKRGWAIHYNNNRYCFITENGFLNNIDENYTNYSNWNLTDEIPNDSIDLINLKSFKQVYSQSMIYNKLRIE